MAKGAYIGIKKIDNEITTEVAKEVKKCGLVSLKLFLLPALLVIKQ